MRPATLWRAWFEPEPGSDLLRVFDSASTPWHELPEDGVILVLVFEREDDRMGRPHRRIVAGMDWYFSDGLELVGGNDDPLEENEFRYPGCSFKRGRWVEGRHYLEVMRTASEDYKLPGAS